MSIVKINAITVPPDKQERFEERFRGRSGAVAKTPGARFAKVMVKVWQVSAVTPLLAQTVVGPKVPAIMPTPAMMPPVFMVFPGGRAPLVTEKVACGVDGVEVNWCA